MLNGIVYTVCQKDGVAIDTGMDGFLDGGEVSAAVGVNDVDSGPGVRGSGQQGDQDAGEAAQGLPFDKDLVYHLLIIA